MVVRHHNEHFIQLNQPLFVGVAIGPHPRIVDNVHHRHKYLELDLEVELLEEYDREDCDQQPPCQ